MKFDFFVYAFNNLKKRGLRSSLTVLGIFIAIVAVVALISLGQGMQNAINQEFETIGKDRIIITAGGVSMGPFGSDLAVAELTEKDVDVIKKVRGVEYVIGMLFHQAKISYNDEVEYKNVAAHPTDQNSARYIKQINLFEIGKGRQLKSSDHYAAVLGYSIANNYFNKKIGVGDKILIQDKQFKVVGIQKKIGTGIHDRIIRIPIDIGRELFNEPDKVTTIFAKVKKTYCVEGVDNENKKKLRKFRHVKEDEEDFTVETAEQLIKNLNVILSIVQVVLIGIAAIALLVGGIGIANTMYTSVLERTREIGIMKAVGARNSDIMFIFLIESGLLGLVGGILGVTVGLGISKGVEVIAALAGYSMLKASFNPFLIIGALAFSFIIGSISGLIPAKQAAELKPVEALRRL